MPKGNRSDGNGFQRASRLPTGLTETGWPVVSTEPAIEDFAVVIPIERELIERGMYAADGTPMPADEVPTEHLTPLVQPPL